jgi:2-phosphosulfolactate phosphatase
MMPVTVSAFSPSNLEVLFAPAEFAALSGRDLSSTTCVVFDVLRATSTMVTALANGAAGIIPVAEIEEAVALRHGNPQLLLAGERDGVRISKEAAGGVAFDLGNSPREFTSERVRGNTIVATTTNGTRALRACAAAHTVLAAAFLNLRATAEFIERARPGQLLLVCSGTASEAAMEDVLAAGALCELVWPMYEGGGISDSARMARRLFNAERNDLLAALGQTRNGRRLLAHPELKDDVGFCARRDVCPMVACLGKDGVLRNWNDEPGNKV